MTTQLLPPEDQINFPIYLRTRIIQSLAGLRQEWEEASKGESLVDVQAPVGLLLADVLERIELNRQEISAVLGPRLYRDVETILTD